MNIVTANQHSFDIHLTSMRLALSLHFLVRVDILSDGLRNAHSDTHPTLMWFPSGTGMTRENQQNTSLEEKYSMWKLFWSRQLLIYGYFFSVNVWEWVV